MKVAIMQPTYLPWVGYFQLMSAVDIFIVLDNVQFSKRSWQQRNKIKTKNGLKWLTVPVISKGKRNQLIFEVEIDYNNKFPYNHISIIKENYHKAPHFDQFSEIIFNTLNKNHKYLSKLTIELISLIKDILQIKTTIKLSSEFKLPGTKDELLANLCHEVGASEYVSAPGSKVYLSDSKYFKTLDININYFDYNVINYNQLHGDFVSHVSVIDYLFNCNNHKNIF